MNCSYDAQSKDGLIVEIEGRGFNLAGVSADRLYLSESPRTRLIPRHSSFTLKLKNRTNEFSRIGYILNPFANYQGSKAIEIRVLATDNDLEQFVRRLHLNSRARLKEKNQNYGIPIS